MNLKRNKKIGSAVISFVIYALIAMWILPIDPSVGDKIWTVVIGIYVVGFSVLMSENV